DIDPQAVATSRANAASNDVVVAFGLPEEFSPEPVDVALANILANPLELMAPLFAARVRARGSIVLSGILEAQVDAVVAAYERWFNIAPWGWQTDGWPWRACGLCADQRVSGIRRETMTDQK